MIVTFGGILAKLPAGPPTSGHLNKKTKSFGAHRIPPGLTKILTILSVKFGQRTRASVFVTDRAQFAAILQTLHKYTAQRHVTPRQLQGRELILVHHLMPGGDKLSAALLLRQRVNVLPTLSAGGQERLVLWERGISNWRPRACWTSEGPPLLA